MRGLSIGEGAANFVASRPDDIEVVASFSRAVYLAAGDETMVVVTRAVPPGPLYLVTDTEAFADVNRASLTGDALKIGPLSIDGVGVVPGWGSPTADPVRLREGSVVAVSALGPLAAGSELADRFAALADWRERLGAGDWGPLVSHLVGYGRGSTPAGDDALAAMLVVVDALGMEVEVPVSADLADRTTRISLPFLEWAGRGQAIEPVHEVLVAAAQNDAVACEAAVDRLAEVGASSGADMAYGMVAGLETLS